MTDTDDVAAAQMFLQRRLEMIWSAALWRDSLLEATLTINPDGTTTLADSYWIPERSVLLLPAAIEKVIAARLNTNTLEVASLESYYRTDTDWLDYQGTPFEFQILKPVVMEWPTAQVVLSALDTDVADGTANPAVVCGFSYSPDGVTITNGAVGSGSATGLGATIGTGGVLQLFSFSKPVTRGNVALCDCVPVSVAGITYTGSPQPTATVPATQGQLYTITPGANESGVFLVNGNQTLTLQSGTAVTVTAQGNQLLFKYPNLLPAGVDYSNGAYLFSVPNPNVAYNLLWGATETSFSYSPGGYTANPGAGNVLNFTPSLVGVTFGSVFPNQNAAVTAQLFLGTTNRSLTVAINQIATFATVMASCNNAAQHQRIRLTEAPQVAVNLRVLGKGKCPVLAPYDSAPITNVEPALMAYARGDLLLRQRQFGKAALAQQEGAALLKELVENEAFQQAGEFRIQPDGGFGSDVLWRTGTDSYHPLG